LFHGEYLETFVNIVEMVNTVHDIFDDDLFGERNCSSMEGEEGFMEGEEGSMGDFDYFLMNEGKMKRRMGVVLKTY